MITVIGADTDNYDGDISVDRFRRFYGNGGRFNIIGLEAEMPFALPQRDNSEAAGLVVPFGYKFLYWQADDLDRMKEAAEKFGRPIAPDIEYGNGMPGGVEATVERMAQAKDLLVSLGLFWGWYSSVSEWQRLTGNTQRFVGDRGWTANYPFAKLGGPPVLPPRDYLPDLSTFQCFGGTTLEVLQYADTCYDEPTWDMNAMRMEEDVLQTERYEGELNSARALKAVMHNLMLTTPVRFDPDDKMTVIMADLQGNEVGRLKLAALPDYDLPA